MNKDKQLDAYQQLKKQQNKHINKKLFKSYASDLISIYIVDNYNNSGLNMDKQLKLLKMFFKNTKLKITDINNAAQLNKWHSELDLFLFDTFFDYWTRQLVIDEEKQRLIKLQKEIYFLYLTQFRKKLMPNARNSSLIALINGNVKPHNFEVKLKEYMKVAIEEKRGLSSGFYTKGLLCWNKVLTGICPDIKECPLEHNICAACDGRHLTRMYSIFLFLLINK